MAKRKKPIIYTHHIFYEHKKPGAKRVSQREVTARVTWHEHKIISDIQRYKPETLSKGFWHSIKVLMAAYEPYARDLDEDGESEV